MGSPITMARVPAAAAGGGRWRQWRVGRAVGTPHLLPLLLHTSAPPWEQQRKHSKQGKQARQRGAPATWKPTDSSDSTPSSLTEMALNRPAGGEGRGERAVGGLAGEQLRSRQQQAATQRRGHGSRGCEPQRATAPTSRTVQQDEGGVHCPELGRRGEGGGGEQGRVRVVAGSEGLPLGPCSPLAALPPRSQAAADPRATPHSCLLLAPTRPAAARACALVSSKGASSGPLNMLQRGWVVVRAVRDGGRRRGPVAAAEAQPPSQKPAAALQDPAAAAAAKSPSRATHFTR